MKTDELIALLAAGPIAIDRGQLRLKFLGALALGVISSVLLMYFGMGLNPELEEGTNSSLLLAKSIVIGGALIAAGLIVFTLQRAASPGKKLGAWLWIVVGIFAAFWCLGIDNFTRLPIADRMDVILYEDWRDCLQSIPLLALPVFAASIWGLRQWAPTHLTLCGALAGFASGAVGAAVYALHCVSYDPTYVALWYSLGIAISTGIGALLGRSLLRW